MPRSRHRGDAAREHAEAIFRALMQARPAGLHMPQLMRATELTRSQVQAGMAMMRDVITTKGWPPVIYTRADGYQFTADPNKQDELHLMQHCAGQQEGRFPWSRPRGHLTVAAGSVR